MSVSPAASSASTEETTASASGRSSIVESITGFGFSGERVDKKELRRRVRIPDRLRIAMAEAVRLKDATILTPPPPAEEEPPEAPMVVFVNSRSGGRYGPVLKDRLQDLIGSQQVFDLSDVKPSDFVQYSLVYLENLASGGDLCANTTRERLRIMVAGGDGTVGWVLGSLQELHVQNRVPIPPIAIIPIGTGNDLSRSFGWGGSFPFGWKSAVKRSLHKAIVNPVSHLDSWHAIITFPKGEEVELPYALRHPEECTHKQEIEGESPRKHSHFGGAFYNYFSIGMDAQVAYSFHQLRNEKPFLASGPIANKLIYSAYSCGQGWFFTPCIGDPSLRGLEKILRAFIKKEQCQDWQQIHIPKSVRAIVALNLHSYASGRHPWGSLKPEYLEKKGFAEARADDGLLEIFGLKQGWHASLVMVELISAKHIAQASSVKFEMRGRQWKHAYMQMDGEPWQQPLSRDYSSFVEITRVPFRSLVINGE